MDFEKLSPKDFKHTETQYFDFYYERSNSNEGELVHTHTYEARCRIFKVNVTLNVTFKNPVRSFEESLPDVKENLRWLEENRENILQRMASQRNTDDVTRKIFNSDYTRKLDDKKFMKFLVLSQITMFGDHSMTLKFNEFDNLSGNFFTFDVSGDRKYQNMGVQGF